MPRARAQAWSHGSTRVHAPGFHSRGDATNGDAGTGHGQGGAPGDQGADLYTSGGSLRKRAAASRQARRRKPLRKRAVGKPGGAGSDGAAATAGARGDARAPGGDDGLPQRVIAEVKVEVEDVNGEPPLLRRRRLQKQRATEAAERLRQERSQVRAIVVCACACVVGSWCAWVRLLRGVGRVGVNVGSTRSELATVWVSHQH